MKELKFLAEYAAGLKPGVIANTVRKGTQWQASKPGDVVQLIITENRKAVAQAGILAVAPTTFAEATKDNAELAGKLHRIYGETIEPTEVFTVVTFLPLNPAE